MPLVLGRQKDEGVVIEIPPSETKRRVYVTVGKILRHKVRLLFNGDEDIIFNRDEVQKRIDDENRAKKG